MAKEKGYPAVWRKHSSPVVKTKDNKSGHMQTSKHVQIEGRAKTGWDSKGQPTHQVNVPGYDKAVGTPGYIKSAAKHAESLVKGSKFDCGYGKQDVHRSHQESLGGSGKPDIKLDKSYHNPVKETK